MSFRNRRALGELVSRATTKLCACMNVAAANRWSFRWAEHDGQLRRSAVGAAVATAHLLAIWLLAEQLMAVPIPFEPRELSLNVASLPPTVPRSPLPQPPMLLPALVVVPVPEIRVEQTDSAQGLALALGANEVIAARPDPNHPNISPRAGNLSCAAGRGAEVVLRVLVQKDGTIGDANVAQSCGTTQLDELALEFAKAHWRYLPAIVAGQAIESWTTVLVHFR